jgi:hypothetical protein
MGPWYADAMIREALDAVEQARLGMDVTDRLLACARALESASDPSSERHAAERAVRLALFAGASRDGVRHVVEAMTAHTRFSPFEVVGLCFREGDPLNEPWADNPWGVPAAATLGQALDAVWAPAREHVATFLRVTRERLVGLAHLRDGRGAAVLGYLTAPAPPFDRRRALAWNGDPSLFLGSAPAPDPQPKPGIVIPEPLRALYRVHGGLREPGFGSWSLASPDELLLWSEMLDHTEPTAVSAEDEDETVDSDELLAFFSYGDDRSDLFELTGDDDPPVRSWGDGMLFAGDEERFWSWFNGRRPPS